MHALQVRDPRARRHPWRCCNCEGWPGIRSAKALDECLDKISGQAITGTPCHSSILAARLLGAVPINVELGDNAATPTVARQLHGLGKRVGDIAEITKPR